MKIKRFTVFTLSVILLIALVGCGSEPSQTTSTPYPTNTPTLTNTPYPTPTFGPTSTPISLEDALLSMGFIESVESESKICTHSFDQCRVLVSSYKDQRIELPDYGVAHIHTTLGGSYKYLLKAQLSAINIVLIAFHLNNTEIDWVNNHIATDITKGRDNTDIKVFDNVKIEVKYGASDYNPGLLIIIAPVDYDWSSD